MSLREIIVDAGQRVFYGEFFWSPAFSSHSPENEKDGWIDPDSEFGRFPKPLLVTANNYFWETGSYDCSMEDSIGIKLPAKHIVQGMKLHHNYREGHCYDSAQRLMAFDPSVFQEGAGALLMNRNAFIEFLAKKDYGVMWTILGEKQILESDVDEYKGRLEISASCFLEDGKFSYSNPICVFEK